MRCRGTVRKQKETKQEYQTAKIHKIDLTNNDMGVGMEILAGCRGKPYRVQLEFRENGNTDAAEEIRTYLKEKYLKEKFGSMQTEKSALQFPTIENGKEDKKQ